MGVNGSAVRRSRPRDRRRVLDYSGPVQKFVRETSYVYTDSLYVVNLERFAVHTWSDSLYVVNLERSAGARPPSPPSSPGTPEVGDVFFRCRNFRVYGSGVELHGVKLRVLQRETALLSFSHPQFA